VFLQFQANADSRTCVASLSGRALMLSLACAACAGARVAGTESGSGSIDAEQAARYEIAETAQPVLGSNAGQALERAVQQAAREAGIALRGDGRLASLARQFANRREDDTAALALAAHARGLVDADLTLRVVRAASAELLAAALASELAAPLRALLPTHFGMFVHPGGRAASIVLGRRPLALEPVPRQLPRAATIHLRGLLAATDRNPKLIVVGPDGSVVLPSGAGPQFELNVPTRTAGVYRLELQALAGEHARALAKLTVYVGVTPLAEKPVAPAPISSSVLRRALYARSNELRAAHGLSPLGVDPRLELSAEHHSQQLTAASAQADPPAAPLAEGTALLTVARGADEAALWTALVSQGAFRAQLLNADVTRIGIGVTQCPSGYVATHVLARPAATHADAELAPARILTALNENRRARGAVALRPDPDLTRIARRAANELAMHPEQSEHDVVERANAELEHFGLGYRRAAAVAALVQDPLEAAALEPALDPEAHAVGVAVAEGERPGMPEARVAVVIALGWER
jgi:uncharacterized protein YkwD